MRKIDLAANQPIARRGRGERWPDWLFAGLSRGACIGLAGLWQQRTYLNIMAQPQRAFGRLWAAAIIVLCLYFGQQTIEGHVNNENVQLALESTLPAAMLQAADTRFRPAARRRPCWSAAPTSTCSPFAPTLALSPGARTSATPPGYSDSASTS